jgi:hypothetical protein
MNNFVYRQVRHVPFDSVDTEGFVVVDRPSVFLRHTLLLIRVLPPVEAIKLFAKSFTASRRFFFIRGSNSLLSHGSLAISFCRYYPVAKNDVVIGTIWTEPSMRGRGLATRAIQSAMNAMIMSGYSSFYIDTQESNHAMQRSIAKLGFGDPVATFST